MLESGLLDGEELAAGAEEAGEAVGRYRILETLGEGATAVVYLAEDPLIGRQVALKLLKPSFALRPERFRRELKVLAELEHPGIVKVHDAGESDGRLFFVMEYVGSRCLADEALPLPWERAVRIVRDAARACEVAHGRGIVHRDLKPANLLLDGERVVVGDFGMAKLLSEKGVTKTGALVGTPAFMAPEAVDPKLGGVGPRTDVYALGAILFELVTGELPHEITSLAQLAEFVRDPRVPDVAARAPSVPAPLAQVVERALAPAPEDRFPSAAALADALDGCLQPASTPPSPRGSTAPPAAPSTPAQALPPAGYLVAAALALAVLVGVALALLSGPRNADRGPASTAGPSAPDGPVAAVDTDSSAVPDAPVGADHPAAADPVAPGSERADDPGPKLDSEPGPSEVRGALERAEAALVAARARGAASRSLHLDALGHLADACAGSESVELAELARLVSLLARREVLREIAREEADLLGPPAARRACRTIASRLARACEGPLDSGLLRGHGDALLLEWRLARRGVKPMLEAGRRLSAARDADPANAEALASIAVLHLIALKSTRKLGLPGRRGIRQTQAAVDRLERAAPQHPDLAALRAGLERWSR